MLRGGDVNEIRSFRREGLSMREISALTGLDRKTIRKYLRQRGLPRYGPRAPRPSKLDEFKPYIEQRLQAGVWNATVLLRELRERGYTGGYSILKDYLQPRRRAVKEVAVRRFETGPGQQAQVDWAELGQEWVTSDGSPDSPARRRRLSGFVMTLGYSRAMYAAVVTDEKLPGFLRLHEEAFRALGGVPQEILYDQVKTVVLGLDRRGELVYHPTFLDFARYWGFTPRVCRPYRPQTKGKVESGIRYLRSSFLCGREAQDVPDLNRQLRQWTWEVANERVHGTTHQRVSEALRFERSQLQPLGNRAPYPLLEEEIRRVSRDAYVAYRSNRYSVPYTSVGKEVRIRERQGIIEIWQGWEKLAEHPLCSGEHQVVTIKEHHAGIAAAEAQQRPAGKRRIVLCPQAPEVERRDLLQYEALAHEALAHEALAHEALAHEVMADSGPEEIGSGQEEQRAYAS